MDGRPKRIKKFAFTIVCFCNRLRVDGALIFSFSEVEILGGPIVKIFSSPDDDGLARLEDILESVRENKLLACCYKF